MSKRRIAICAAILSLFQSLPALADMTVASIDACLTQKFELGQNPTSCIDQAHLKCLQTSSATPAVAMLCFVEARNVWNRATAAEMERITAKAPETITTIAAIELKYDLIANRTQCDRMEELALAASSNSGDAIQRQKSRCEATASGLAYVRLKLRAQSIE